jgi:transposase
LGKDLAKFHPGDRQETKDPMGAMFYGRPFCDGKERGSKVEIARRGRGSKLMVVADGQGIPLAVSFHSAAPHEQVLIRETIKHLPGKPERLIGDKAYDSNCLREDFRNQGIELIAPARSFRIKKVQDGRSLRRNQHRWKIERTIAWIARYRRLTVRWETNHKMYQAFVHIACALITYRYL